MLERVAGIELALSAWEADCHWDLRCRGGCAQGTVPRVPQFERLTRAQVVAKACAEWERDCVGRTKPDPGLRPRPSVTGGMVTMSAGPEADADLRRRVAEALSEAGLPVEWDK